MGLFSFVKNAGAKIFGGGDKAEAEARPLTPDEEIEFAVKIKDTVAPYGFDIRNFGVRFTAGTALVRGFTTSQSEREKVVLTVGNIQGVSQVDDRIEVERPAPVEAAEPTPEPQPAVFHTVASGDSLSAIAKQHYGSAAMYGVVFEANKPMLKHPDAIYPGQVLRIPPMAEGVFHTVASGETLGKIAKQWLGKSSRYTEIYEANRDQLSSPDAISVGQRLRIPVEPAALV